MRNLSTGLPQASTRVTVISDMNAENHSAPRAFRRLGLAGVVAVLMSLVPVAAGALEKCPGGRERVSDDGHQRVCVSEGGNPEPTASSSGSGTGCSSGTADVTVTDSRGTRNSRTGGESGSCPTANPAVAGQTGSARPTVSSAAAVSRPAPTPTEAAVAVSSPAAAKPQIVLGGIDRAAAAADVGSGGGGMSLASYVSIALMLALFGGVLFFLFRRRSRWSKIAIGTPAVLQPRAGSMSESLPSTLMDDTRPSRFQEPPTPSAHTTDDVRPTPAPQRNKPAPSPIVELHFIPEPKTEPKTEESSTTNLPPLLAAFTEADVTEGKTGWPASA